MKQIILKALILASLNVATVPAHAATFHVNGATGNDNNNGSVSAPWKSISKAANTLAAGDSVIIRAGVYRETVTPLNSGTAANPITYKAEPGAEVIISGTDLLTSPWSQHSGNIYKANVQLPLGDGAQLFVNGNMMMEASWPNNPGTASDTTWLVERKLSTATEGTEIIPPPTIPTRYSIVGGDINVAVPVGSRVFISTMLGHGWVNYTCEVVDYDPGSKKITFDVPFVLDPDKNKVSYDKGANARKSLFFLHGDLSYLDMEKEYFYDSAAGTLYLYQPGGGIPLAGSVEYKARNTGINLNGRKFITVEGIGLFACNLISDNNSGNIKVIGLDGKYLSHWSTSYVPADIVGIKLFGSSNEIGNSNISYSIGHGIHVSGSNTKIINNRVTDCSYLGLYRNNIWVDGSHHVVSYNTALRSGRSILGGKFSNTKISNNEFAYANYLSADGACIYLGFWDTGNSEISHNYVHHTGDPASTAGIYFDNYCHNAIIHHNYTDGMQINGPRSGMTIVNNTIVGRGLVWDYWVKDGNKQYIYAEDGSGTYIANNIISRNSMNLNRVQPIYDIMNWDESQRGVGTAKVLGNGGLSSDSPCIDVAGVETLPYIHSNVTDGKPDLGAFEYGVAAWEYGHDFSINRESQLTDFNFPMMNQMKNPGFELGVNGWTNGFTSIHSGKRGKAARVAGNSSIHQTLVGLKPNSIYQVAAWSKVKELDGTPVGTPGGTPVIVVSGYGGINISKNGDMLSTGWTLNVLEITTGPLNTSAKIYLKNDGSGFVDWDQAGVYIKHPANTTIKPQ